MFRAAAKGRDLQLDNAGVIGSNEVFQDLETGSRWQQSSLQAISGPLKGEHLELYPFLLTDWGEWHRLHPDTLVLKPLPGYADRIAERNEMIRQGLSGEGSAPPGVLRVDDRLKPKTMVLGLVVGGSDEAFPLTVLRQAHIINEEIGGQPVLVVHQPTSDTTTAFIARVKGTRLKFRAANAPGALKERSAPPPTRPAPAPGLRRRCPTLSPGSARETGSPRAFRGRGCRADRLFWSRSIGLPGRNSIQIRKSTWPRSQNLKPAPAWSTEPLFSQKSWRGVLPARLH